MYCFALEFFNYLYHTIQFNSLWNTLSSLLKRSLVPQAPTRTTGFRYRVLYRDTTNSAASAMPCEPFPMGNLDRKLQRWNWLERDTAIQVLTLDSIDWSKQRIADYLGITRNQEKNLLERLTWARAHVNWTRDDWCRIIWTDETWVTPGYHRKVRVTRRADEERHPDCLRPRRRKCGGWMFWASFLGLEKGPSLFWEKEWGWIDAEGYVSHIAPLMEGFFRLRKDRNPIVMQDNAPGHSAKETIEYFEELGVCIMAWPAFSPDLNPIESVWNWMKDWIEEKYGDQYMTPTTLRGVVRDAGDAVPEDFLNGLIESMPARCQAVIDAQGGAAKY
ncbi:hypothetical protein PDIDSM_6440 [Penicillium digitatum]|nr:hypothetical protein PDIDSM_6440 [Penicillium digitatum]